MPAATEHAMPSDRTAEDPSASRVGPGTQETNVGPSPMWRWFWFGLLLAALPLLIPYFAGMWAYPRYRYFPFAIAAVCYLGYVRSDGKCYPPRGWVSWAVIGGSLLLLIAAAVLQFTWFAAVAAVLIAGTLLYTSRGPEDDSLVVLVLPLATLVQLIRADVLLVQYLQYITTWLSSVLLDVFTVPHAIANNVIQLADRELFVAEACSGIQSVFTLAFLALLMVAWRRRRIWMAPIYLAIAGLLAVFANVIRVTTVALAETWYEVDLAVGWPHDLIGYFALAVAAGFLLSFDYLISTIWHRVSDETEMNPFVIGWNYIALKPDSGQHTRTTSWSALEQQDGDRSSRVAHWAEYWVGHRGAQIGFVSVALLICGASVIQVVRSRKPVDIVFSDGDVVFDPPSDLFHDSLNVLTVVDHQVNRGYEEPRLGANSDVWECEWDDVSAQFVLSQPHKGWHELCDCYERLDWALLDRDIRSPEELERLEVTAAVPDAMRSTYVVARFKRGPAQRGYLMFAGIGSDGTLVEAPDSLTAFTHRVWNRIDSTGVWDQNEVVMLQMFVIAPKKLTADRVKELEHEFIAVRARIAEAIADNAGRQLPRSADRGRPVKPDAVAIARETPQSSEVQ
jgi:exosortase